MNEFTRILFQNILYIIVIMCVVYTIGTSKRLFKNHYELYVETSFRDHFVIRWSMFIAGIFFGIGTYYFVTDYGSGLLQYLLLYFGK